MNSVIKRELEKIHAPLPEYDDNTIEIHIPQKQVTNEPLFEVGKSYQVQLADYILNEPPNFTLSSNWNKGVVPKSQFMLMQVRELTGKMLKVYARGYDVNTDACLEDMYYDFWLPLGGVTKLKEI